MLAVDHPISPRISPYLPASPRISPYQVVCWQSITDDSAARAFMIGFYRTVGPNPNPNPNPHPNASLTLTLTAQVVHGN